MLNLLIFAIIFLPISTQITDFNPCNVDDSTCMPLEDFEQNCTCILLPDDNFYNVTDDLYLFMTGYPIHMSYITQAEMEPLFRKKLSLRIPKSHYYDASAVDENIYRNLRISEKMALFVVASDKSAEYLRSEAIAQKDNRWCLEGECNAFVYESNVVNKTEASSAHFPIIKIPENWDN
uniref:Uncharacterized protein n=1 Tax=Caenorhabditis japonica TaxID=281687 RepID=A0A8R1ICQ6_CAEJA